MFTCRLPDFLKFLTTKDLERVGRDHDGGYLISASDMEKSDFLLSFGICDDWSFEWQFYQSNKIPVAAFDGSVDKKFWLKRIIIGFLKNPLSPKEILKYFSFHSFFSGACSFQTAFIGQASLLGNTLSLNEVIPDEKFQNIFLKVDIEGAEYRILNDILTHQDRFSGLVIEFHNCDLFCEQIREFVENFQLKLIHIHANNYSPIFVNSIMPSVMEMTFSRYGFAAVAPELPHTLDMANDKNVAEIKLEF